VFHTNTSYLPYFEFVHLLIVTTCYKGSAQVSEETDSEEARYCNDDLGECDFADQSSDSEEISATEDFSVSKKMRNSISSCFFLLFLDDEDDK
jgi:hypothetical protein